MRRVRGAATGPAGSEPAWVVMCDDGQLASLGDISHCFALKMNVLPSPTSIA